MKKIGFIVNDAELMQRLENLYPQELAEGRILAEIARFDDLGAQGRALEAGGVDAIIARSGVYKEVTAAVGVPLIRLKMTYTEILDALKQASEGDKQIVLILRSHLHFHYEEWEHILNQTIHIENYDNKDEIEERVRKYLAQKESTVIIGGGIAFRKARQYGFDAVFLNAKDDSIRETVEYAWNLIDELHEEKLRTRIAEAVLNNVHDAIVAVNTQGNIILCNRQAGKLLGVSVSQVLHKSLAEALPQLRFLLEEMRRGLHSVDSIKKFGQRVMNVNSAPLSIKGEVHGFLCSFRDITELRRLEEKIRHKLSKKGLVARWHFDEITAQDPTMTATLAKAQKIAATESTLLIYGESGTGKEVLAQSIHNFSARRNAPFVAINCAAISESLLESELFGYEEGAFTGAKKSGKRGLFELAHGGTIFLDEINSISVNLQANLLRVLEEKEVMRLGSDYVIPLDVRVIAAANEELKQNMLRGAFRVDLFYRLSTLELLLPPLRERQGDILPLFQHFLRQLSGGNVADIPPEFTEPLLQYDWPGNVRELRNIAQRYLILGELQLDSPRERTPEHSQPDTSDVKQFHIDIKEINRYVESKVIDMLLQQGGTKTDIAKMLGISRTALWKKMRKFSS